LAGHKVDAIRNCDKASFCVIDKDDVQPEKYTTFFRSVIAFGRIHIIEDEQENRKLPVCLVIGTILIKKKPCRKNWKRAWLAW